MDILLDFAGVAGPAIAGLLTVPALQGVKKVSGLVQKAPATVKQFLGIGIAFGLTKLGAAANVALPPSLELFDGSSTEALIAAGIAFGVHAGKKARDNAPRGL